jgi:hypothetical protein
VAVVGSIPGVLLLVAVQLLPADWAAGVIVLLVAAAVVLFRMARTSAGLLAEVRRHHLMIGVGEPPEPHGGRV